MISIPKGLHPSTVELVESFATALAEKLHRSEIKYGWSDGWKDADWQEKCLADFNHHIDKGDPRDVAAYCAFMWFHGWQTRHTTPPAQLLRPVELPGGFSPAIGDIFDRQAPVMRRDREEGCWIHKAVVAELLRSLGHEVKND